MILVDTHVVVWIAFESSKLSTNARAAVSEARKSGDGLAVSGITLLELAGLSGKKHLQLNMSLESFLNEVEARFVVVPISGRACARTMELPSAYPKDPADRLIGATALVEGWPLITADSGIRRSEALRTIW